MSVSNLDIRNALYGYLATMDDLPPWNSDGESIATTGLSIYDHLIPNEIMYPTKTKQGYNAAPGIYQINVYINRGHGRFELMEKADEIVNHMSTPVELICDSGRITIESVYPSRVMYDEGHMMIAVTINYLLVG
jgi:hypothetical protein